MYLRAGRIVGYTRINLAAPSKAPVFLAADPDAAHAIAAPFTEVSLHPLSKSSAALGSSQVEAWDAGMACALVCSELDAFWTSGRRPGRPVWPVEFDLV